MYSYFKRLILAHYKDFIWKENANAAAKGRGANGRSYGSVTAAARHR